MKGYTLKDCCKCLISGYYQITAPNKLPVQADFTIQSGSATWGTPGGVPSWTLNADGTIVTLNRSSSGKQAYKYTVESPNYGEIVGLILGWKDASNYLIAEMEMGVCYRILQRVSGTENILCEALAGFSTSTGGTKLGGFIACYDPETHLFRLSAAEQKLNFNNGLVHIEAEVPYPASVGQQPGFYRRAAAANPIFHFDRFTKYRNVAKSQYLTNECPACGQTCVISIGPAASGPPAQTPTYWADTIGAWTSTSTHAQIIGNGRLILKREARNEIHAYRLSFQQPAVLQRAVRIRMICNFVDDNNFNFVEADFMMSIFGTPTNPMEFGIYRGGVKTILATHPSISWNNAVSAQVAQIGQSEQMLYVNPGFGVFQDPLPDGKRVGFEVLNSTTTVQVSWGSFREQIPLEPSDATAFMGIGNECQQPNPFPQCGFISDQVTVEMNGWATGGLPHLNGIWTLPWYFSYWSTPVMNFPAPWTDPAFDPIIPKFVDRFQIYGTWYAQWFNHLGTGYTGPQIVVRIFQQAPANVSYEIIRFMGSFSMAGLGMHCENFTTVDADWPTLIREPGAHVGGLPFGAPWPPENPTINMDAL